MHLELTIESWNPNELQDTLKSSPAENKVMKRASFVGVSTTTMFYVLCGCVGYAAFGNDAPGNFLTGFGFYEPFWLIDLANVCIAIHLIGAYQVNILIFPPPYILIFGLIIPCWVMSRHNVTLLLLCTNHIMHVLIWFHEVLTLFSHKQVFCQPIFGFVEKWCARHWPENKFITREHALNIPCYGVYYINSFRLVWRTVYVIVTAVIAMIFPFFNDFVGLLGAASFWPLTVYFPIEMYIAQSKLPKFSFTWTWLKILSWACLVVSIVAAAGSIQGLAQDVKTYKPFKTQ